MQKWTDTVIFVFVSGSGQPFAINAVNSFLLNMEKAYNKAHPEEAIPHLSAHILRHTGCIPCLHPQEWISRHCRTLWGILTQVSQ